MTCTNCGENQNKGTQIQTLETTEVRSWTSLPLIDVTDVPEDLDLICGSNEKYKSWRIPASYFLSGGLNSTRYSVGVETELEPNQVKPVYFATGTSSAIPAKAMEGETATDLVVESSDGKSTIMNSGYYTFTRPHKYVVGKTYYLSQENEGEVVSVKPEAGIIQALFTVVDQLTISIKIDEPRS